MIKRKKTTSHRRTKKKMAKTKSEQKEDEVLLGLDYGTTNIGLALGKAGLALPLEVVSAKDSPAAITKISQVAIDNHATRIVIGLPLTSKGKDTQQARKVRSFAKLLKSTLHKPVVFEDEFSSTIESVKEAISSGISQKRRKSVDHISAAIILKNYYEGNSQKKN